MEKISKISQTNKIPKRQHKEKNSQSNNRYSEPKKKKENFKEILENEEQLRNAIKQTGYTLTEIEIADVPEKKGFFAAMKSGKKDK